MPRSSVGDPRTITERDEVLATGARRYRGTLRLEVSDCNTDMKLVAAALSDGATVNICM